jgi:hypothetical protein
MSVARVTVGGGGLIAALGILAKGYTMEIFCRGYRDFYVLFIVLQVRKLSDPLTNDCGGAVAVAYIGYTEVVEKTRPTDPRWQSDECLYRCLFPLQLDRQAIQHLLS